MEIPYKINLSEKEIPKYWLNMNAVIKDPSPLINPENKQPLSAKDISPVFCSELAEQEVSTQEKIEIPDEVRECYKIYRPAPLIRAYRLEKELKTPAKIFYKFEGNNTSGSHKLNSAIPQAYYAKKQGLKGITTETGAGQWGTALSIAAAMFGLDLKVFMVKSSYLQKPYRKAVMNTFGADVTASPSETTKIGSAILQGDPNDGGSLGTAISEAVEAAVTSQGYRYVLGSVLNQVLLHQSVIGIESKAALEKFDLYPDIIVGCAGGGSNLGGLIAPFIFDKIKGKSSSKIIAIEPASCPSLTRGSYVYDYCDVGHITPMAKMYTLGAGFKPAAIHAGGLRYHGMSPILSRLYHDKLISARSYRQTEVFDAAVLFSRCETILPAPESSHAIKGAIDEAIACRESGEAKTILFGLTGTGFFDMTAYNQYLEGAMTDYVPSDEEIAMSLSGLK